MMPRTCRADPWPREPATALLLGRVELWQLAQPLADLYHLGFIDGQASLQQALAEAHSAADRYYRRAFDSRARRHSVPAISFAELCRIRGEYDRADAAERSLARRFSSPPAAA